MKIYSWNVDGIRAAQRAGFLDWLYREQPDIVCLQRTLAKPDQLEPELREPNGYHTYWIGSNDRHNGGTALLSKVKPESVTFEHGVAQLDESGRAVVAEYPDFTLIMCQFGIYLEELDDQLGWALDLADASQDKGKSVIFGGDLRICHRASDTWNPDRYLPQDEANIIDLLEHEGYIDIYDELHPDRRDTYTYWDGKPLRDANHGHRWHMFFISPDLRAKVSSADIHSDERMRVRQCPISLTLSTQASQSVASQPPARDQLNLPVDAQHMSLKHIGRLTRKEGKAGFVYVIHDYKYTKTYKIGRTKEPLRRLSSLGIELPFEIERIFVLRTRDSRALERYLHKRYKDVRVKGEWFALTEEHLAEIKSIGN